MTIDGLVEPCRRFISDVTAGLRAVTSTVTGVRTDRLGQDVALEAFNLVCGLIVSDGVVTEDELWAVLGAFGPLLETRLAGATPQALRDSGLVEGHRDGKQVCYRISPAIQRALANRQGQALDFGCCELRFPETALLSIRRAG